MRPATEPAIDSVPDENIREVKERKALCVQIAPIGEPGNTSIDFEKEEAFRDVPTNLSLCVEPGEIPSSPMTQAKETAWCKGYVRKAESGAHEKSISQAQFVVNCDDDGVVLMENKPTHGRSAASALVKDESTKKSPDCERPTRKSAKGGSTSEAVTPRAQTGHKGQGKKYVLQELGDSIIIEGIGTGDNKGACARKKGCGSVEENTGDTKSKGSDRKTEQPSKEPATGKSKSKSKSPTVQNSSRKDVGSTEARNTEKRVDPIAEVEEIEAAAVTDSSKISHSKPTENVETPCKSIEKSKSPSLEMPSDDFSSMEYHMIDTITCTKDNTLSNQSDEDIEHIQSCDIAQMHQSECIDADKCTDTTSCAGSSPSIHRKNSKNTISDDDLEYIHTSELTEASDVKCSKEDTKLADIEKASDCDTSAATRSSRQVVSSDDDLEHIQHSDVCPLLSESAPLGDSHEKHTTKKQQESCTDHASKSKCTKKLKDIVVIESDTTAADVTVIVKPLEEWNKGKDTQKKTTEELEEAADTRDPANSDTSPSAGRKVKLRKSAASVSTSKRSQAGNIEIIDIDAMQKAEMEVLADVAPTPECKILSGHHEVSGARTKKPRKNKKSHAETGAQSAVLPEPSSSLGCAKSVEPQEPEKTESDSSEPQVPPAGISWSAVVKKKTAPPVDVESRTEEDPKQSETCEKVESKETTKCNSSVEKAEDTKRNVREPSLEKNLDCETKNVQLTSEAESSLNQSSAVIDELREAVTELDADITALKAELPRGSGKKKNSSLQRETRKISMPDVATIGDSDPTLAETKSRREKDHSLERSSLNQSSAVIDELHEAVTELDADIVALKTELPRGSGKKKNSSLQWETRKISMPGVETIGDIDPTLADTKSRRKQDLSFDMFKHIQPKVSASKSNSKSSTAKCVDPIPTTDEPKKSKDSSAKLGMPERNIEEKVSSSQCSSENCVAEYLDPVLTLDEFLAPDRQKKFEESFSQLDPLEKVVEDVLDDERSKPENDQAQAAHRGSSKENSSEPEREPEPEKKSDSDQEIVPERSSSSEELNANAFFRNKEGDYSGRGVVEKRNTNGSTSGASSTAKKGDRSKKKKRR